MAKKSPEEPIVDAEVPAPPPNPEPTEEGITPAPYDDAVQSPFIQHSSPYMHVVKDTDGLPIGHPGEQPRHVIERALNRAGLAE